MYQMNGGISQSNEPTWLEGCEPQSLIYEYSLSRLRNIHRKRRNPCNIQGRSLGGDVDPQARQARISSQNKAGRTLFRCEYHLRPGQQSLRCLIRRRADRTNAGCHPRKSLIQ